MIFQGREFMHVSFYLPQFQTFPFNVYVQRYVHILIVHGWPHYNNKHGDCRVVNVRLIREE